MTRPWYDVLEYYNPGQSGAHTESSEKLCGGVYSDTVGIRVYDTRKDRIGRLSYLWMGVDGLPSTFIVVPDTATYQGWVYKTDGELDKDIKPGWSKHWEANRKDLVPLNRLWDGTPFIDIFCDCGTPVLKDDYLCRNCRDKL